MVITSLAGNKRICWGGAGRNNTMKVMLTENHVFVKAQLSIKLTIAYYC